MKKPLFLSTACLLFCCCISNASVPSIETTGRTSLLNLDFYETDHKTKLPAKWMVNTVDGKYSAELEIRSPELPALKLSAKGAYGDDVFTPFSSSLPLSLIRGKEIEYRGRIRTDSVNTGYAGLWFRVDFMDKTGYKMLGFDNMHDRGVKGTTEWQDASIKMAVSEDATSVFVGGLLVGDGTAWFSGIELYIDGEKFDDKNYFPTELSREQKKWLKGYVRPLKSYEPDYASDSDLRVLGDMIGDATVVGLGEVTHGSREVFKMKHRIVKYLRENHGFDIFSIEAAMPEAYRINDYVLGGDGDPADLIRGMYFWTWRTEEVFDMVEWMRAHNSSSEEKIQFTGFDMQYYQKAVENLRRAFRGNEEVSRVISKLEKKFEDRPTTRVHMRLQAADAEIQKLIQELREAVTRELPSDKDKDWMLQNVRVLEQCATDQTMRDKFMAENTMWVLNNNPGSKLALWAHNGHVKKGNGLQGKYLADSLGSNYVNIGFTTSRGTYTASGKEGSTTYHLQRPYPGTYEYYFDMMDEPVFALDLREMRKDESAYGEWIRNLLRLRSIGALAMSEQFFTEDIFDKYDIIIYIDETTHSRLLPAK